ncbi:biliverdin-producing heme oxygenase [Roseibium algae]|uniref:Biliverdin-producing heme oxygenase n=1 Tax=Roseibium algae TaxID=3123038 RepID=A0ABU8TEA5_9HYPH
MTMTDVEIRPVFESRTKCLKAATHTVHEKLDAGIMAHEPFSSRARYSVFLKVQYAFHRDIDALFSDPILAKLLPDLDRRRRLDLIAQDLVDLGNELPAMKTEPIFVDGKDLPRALGWLYVAEGSNLGAAFLLKAAAAIGLSEIFGARHLSAAPEGRGLHWRTFTAALDEVPLSDEQERVAIAGAEAAFQRVRELVREFFD